jgi:hypothetical protein
LVVWWLITDKKPTSSGDVPEATPSQSTSEQSGIKYLHGKNKGALS